MSHSILAMFSNLSSGCRDEDWQDNDGALNTISQLYPRWPYEHPHCDLGPDLNDLKEGQILQPGIW